MTLKEQLAQLKTLAQAATIGEWEHVGGGALIGGHRREYGEASFKDVLVMVCPVSPDRWGNQQKNADFIQAVSPRNFLELIERIEGELRLVAKREVAEEI